MLFAVFSFLFDQIFSEKVQNVANNLKIVWKKFGEHILDLREKIPFFLKKILHFFVTDLEIILKIQFSKIVINSEFNHPKKLQIFCICAKDYLLDNII